MRGDEFNDRSESYRLQMKVFEAFRREARSAHEEAVVLLLPDRLTVDRVRSGHPPVYAPLARDLARDSITFLDVSDAFRAQPDTADANRWFASQGHYSAEGGAIIARWLATRLRAP